MNLTTKPIFRHDSTRQTPRAVPLARYCGRSGPSHPSHDRPAASLVIRLLEPLLVLLLAAAGVSPAADTIDANAKYAYGGNIRHFWRIIAKLPLQP